MKETRSLLVHLSVPETSQIWKYSIYHMANEIYPVHKRAKNEPVIVFS